MAKNAYTDWSTTAGDNTDIGGITLAENVMLPSGVNDAFREMMAQLKTAGFIGSSVFVAASAAGQSKFYFHEDTDNGTNKIILQGPASVASDKTVSFQDVTGTVYVSGGTDVAVADGGTNISSYTAGDLLYASGATTLSKLAKGTASQVLAMNAGATAPEWVAPPGITLGTPQSPSGVSSVDFTGIPSTAKLIILTATATSTTSSGALQCQLGDSGGIETSGYTGFNAQMTTGSGNQQGSLSSAFIEGGNESASDAAYSMIFLTLIDSSTFTWQCAFLSSRSGSVTVTMGTKSTSAALDRVRLSYSAGNFDAGKINIAYI